jgi:hypothetical protein
MARVRVRVRNVTRRNVTLRVLRQGLGLGLGLGLWFLRQGIGQGVG